MDKMTIEEVEEWADEKNGAVGYPWPKIQKIARQLADTMREVEHLHLMLAARDKLIEQHDNAMRENERLRGSLRMCLGACEQARQETVVALVQAECIKALSNKHPETITVVDPNCTTSMRFTSSQNPSTYTGDGRGKGQTQCPNCGSTKHPLCATKTSEE